jgi:hypothetical protein
MSMTGTLRGQTMARARRRKQGQVDAGEGKVLVRAIIDVCPICQATPDTFAFPDDIAGHLQTHAPSDKCRYCQEKQVAWKVDRDTVHYPKPGLYFYCDPCGRYGQEHIREEVNSAGEA